MLTEVMSGRGFEVKVDTGSKRLPFPGYSVVGGNLFEHHRSSSWVAPSFGECLNSCCPLWEAVQLAEGSLCLLLQRNPGELHDERWSLGPLLRRQRRGWDPSTHLVCDCKSAWGPGRSSGDRATRQQNCCTHQNPEQWLLPELSQGRGLQEGLLL